MRAGRLRHRLSLQKNTVSVSSVGTSTPSWGTVATIWGSIEPLRGKEFYDSALINADISAKIVIRYTSDIEPEYKIGFGSRTFKIHSILDVDERNREMNLMVIEELER